LFAGRSAPLRAGFTPFRDRATQLDKQWREGLNSELSRRVNLIQLCLIQSP
jgi:hypothetical protein